MKTWLRMMWLRVKHWRQIQHNKKHGLLCACNRETIPYYDDNGNEHGYKVTEDGVMHGYDDCDTEDERS